MFNDLKSYFYVNVLVLYKDYAKTKKNTKLGLSNDLRTAINLSSSLFHLREHIPLNDRKSRQHYINLCEDYRLLADIVNASKHGIITQNSPLFSDIKNAYEIAIITDYKDDKGEYKHIEKSVFAKLDDGTERDLNDVIHNVINMWITELNRLEVLDKYSLKKVPKFKIPRRTKNSGNLNFIAMQGLRFGAQIKLQKYNYLKGIIEPIDLTGVKIESRIYEPKYTCLLTFIKDGQDEIKIEIDIEEQEYKKLNRLSEEERMKCLLQIAKMQGKIE